MPRGLPGFAGAPFPSGWHAGFPCGPSAPADITRLFQGVCGPLGTQGSMQLLSSGLNTHRTKEQWQTVWCAEVPPPTRCPGWWPASCSSCGAGGHTRGQGGPAIGHPSAGTVGSVPCGRCAQTERAARGCHTRLEQVWGRRGAGGVIHRTPAGGGGATGRGCRVFREDQALLLAGGGAQAERSWKIVGFLAGGKAGG